VPDGLGYLFGEFLLGLHRICQVVYIRSQEYQGEEEHGEVAVLIPFVAKAYVMDEEFDEVEEETEGGDESVGQDQALATLRIVDEELGNFLR